jgi:hypothetical protein
LNVLFSTLFERQGDAKRPRMYILEPIRGHLTSVIIDSDGASLVIDPDPRFQHGMCTPEDWIDKLQYSTETPYLKIRELYCRADTGRRGGQALVVRMRE